MEERTFDRDAQELACAMEDGASAVGLLAQLYRKELDREAIDSLRAMRFPAHTGNDDSDKGALALVTYLSGAGAHAEEELAADFTRVFLGSGLDSFSAAYPVESVHTGRKRLVMQGARDEVLAIYRSFGLERLEGLKEGEDHIAYELAFLQFIMERTARACREGRDGEVCQLLETQRNFLDDHLLNWVPRFAEQMRFFSKTEFYRGLSYLTVGYLNDCDALVDEALALVSAPVEGE